MTQIMRSIGTSHFCLIGLVGSLQVPIILFCFHIQLDKEHHLLKLMLILKGRLSMNSRHLDFRKFYLHVCHKKLEIVTIPRGNYISKKSIWKMFSTCIMTCQQVDKNRLIVGWTMP